MKMVQKRKWTYWYKVIDVDSKDHGSFEVGQIFGGNKRHGLEWNSWSKERGFYIMARIQYLGKLPFDLHEKDPKEAMRRIDAGEWS